MLTASNDLVYKVPAGGDVSGLYFRGAYYDFKGKAHHCEHKHKTVDEAWDCGVEMLSEFKRKNRSWRKKAKR